MLVVRRFLDLMTIYLSLRSLSPLILLFISPHDHLLRRDGSASVRSFRGRDERDRILVASPVPELEVGRVQEDGHAGLRVSPEWQSVIGTGGAQEDSPLAENEKNEKSDIGGTSAADKLRVLPIN